VFGADVFGANVFGANVFARLQPSDELPLELLGWMHSRVT
jgi:hypothetical protein